MRRSPVRVRPQAPESFRVFGGTFVFIVYKNSKRGSVGTPTAVGVQRATARRAALSESQSSAFVMRRSPVRVRPQAPLTLPSFRKGFCFFSRFSALKRDRISLLPLCFLHLISPPAQPPLHRTPETLPLSRQRCATACPRAPDRRRARCRTRSAPCLPGRWSAADAPCSAPR